MDFATLLVVAQNLLAALQSSQFKEICCILGYKSEFEQFCNSVSAVRAVLLDVSVKQELPHEVQLWIEDLKVLVYEDDDLLDEFISLSEQQLPIECDKVSEEVCLFFSRYDLSGVADNLFKGVTKIREILDTTAISQNLSGFSVDYLPVRRREGIQSFVSADKMIGREEDVEHIVDMLCDFNVQQDVSLLTVVGAGGIGKTALARLVYDEERVSSAFSVRLWGCISDIDQHQFDVNQILDQILRTAAGCKFNDSTDEMLEQLLEQIEGRKFLLVLDDIWTKNRGQWLKLVEFFKAGKKGSWIVVTTRSRETAKVIGSGPIYELQGLSEENSWSLFGKMAFEQATPVDDFVKVGQMIVKNCAGVPLAIRVVGSLLYGQDKSKWLSFQDIVESTNIRDCENISPLLKLSYQHLESSLKSCFSCCAIFPKEFEIEKELLVSIWMAQGYIIPLDRSQSTEDAGEEYFSILFWRCFLHDLQFDEYGEIVSCKVHSLMHDIVQETVGKEFCATNCITSDTDTDRKVQHHSIMNKRYTRSTFIKPCIRVYLHVGRMDQIFTNQLLKSLACLRALVLKDSGLEYLPDSIGKMLHLRCLDLSENFSLVVLPKSITNLYNLQSLRLRSCKRLKELPQDLHKLVKLRVLDVTKCYWLDYMPSNLGMLTCLHTLTKYPVEVSDKQCFYQLQGLKALKHLKGNLDIYIRFPRNPNYVRQDVTEGSYLRSKDGLKNINFLLQHVENDVGVPYEEALLDDMQPHPNLRGLMFLGYRGVKMPSWAKDDNLATFFPHIVKLQLSNCVNLNYLPILGSLCHLKSLALYNLPYLKYMDVTESGAVAKEQTFFPRLEELCLCNLPNLKGWCKDAVPCFPQLKLLRIDSCPEMASLLLCPSMEDLQLLQFNRKLRISITENQDESWKASSSSCHSSSLPEARNMCRSKLRSLIIDNIIWCNSLPTEAFQCLSHICTFRNKLESLSQIEEVFRSCSSSLQSLIIEDCPELKSLSGGLEHLTALERLVLEYNPNLLISSDAEGEKDRMPWRSFGQSLHSLELNELPKLMNLPTGMQYLTNLRVLSILFCPELQSLPEWIQKLTFLRRLEIINCSYRLPERCQYPNGKDWSKIQHIPHFSIQ